MGRSQRANSVSRASKQTKLGECVESRLRSLGVEDAWAEGALVPAAREAVAVHGATRGKPRAIQQTAQTLLGPSQHPSQEAGCEPPVLLWLGQPLTFPGMPSFNLLQDILGVALPPPAEGKGPILCAQEESSRGRCILHPIKAVASLLLCSQARRSIRHSFSYGKRLCCASPPRSINSSTTVRIFRRKLLVFFFPSLPSP